MSRRMGLARSLGPVSMWAMAVSASSPLTVLAGGIPTTYLATGVVGVPLSFVVLTAALLPLTISYVASSRHITHAATAYALLAQGRGRAAGVGGGVVALVSYSAIGISLFGLLGSAAAGMLGGRWWVWALAAWAVVGVCGLFRNTMNASLIMAGVVVQLVIVGAVVWSAFAHPAGGAVRVDGLAPGALFVDGVGGAFAFSLAAFIGYESPSVYAEEARSPKAAGRATFTALGFLGLVYALVAVALAVGVGADQIPALAGDPSTVFRSLLGGWAGVAQAVLWGAIVVAMLSFHNLSVRYLYALGRERVLPSVLGRVGRGVWAGAPKAASLFQSTVALAAIVVAAVLDVDPLAGLFVVFSTLAAIGVLSLLVACSWAAAGFFARGLHGQEGWLTTNVAPPLGVLLGGGVLAAMVTNLHALLNVAPGSVSTLVLPSLIAATAIGGGVWAVWLRRTRPDVYEGIGYQGIGPGRPSVTGRLDPRLAELKG